MINFINVILSK